MDGSVESMKSGVLEFLSRNSRTGFTEHQILSAFFGRAENASEEEKNGMHDAIESLVADKSIVKSTIRAKSGVKIYYKSTE